LIVNAFTIM